LEDLKLPVRASKRRYLAFLLNSKAHINPKSVYEVISKSINKLYGLKGIMDSNLKLIEYDEVSKTGILRCNHIFLRSLRASLAMITDFDSIPASVHVIKTSGTIKSLKKKLKDLDRPFS
jgi:RNase P/RNase MRP subunit POP5